MNYDIRKRRGELNLTIEQLAEKVGVSTATVSRWERNDIRSLRSEHLYPLSDALGIPVIMLLNSIPEPHKPPAL